MLLTDAVKAQLLQNGRDREANQHPVVKLFVPFGAATWLLTQLDPRDKDVAFGLCDMGQGGPELGSVRISELESIRMFGAPAVERDEHCEAAYPLSVYSAVASFRRRIIDDNDHPLLKEAATWQKPKGQTPQPE